MSSLIVKTEISSALIVSLVKSETARVLRNFTRINAPSFKEYLKDYQDIDLLASKNDIARNTRRCVRRLLSQLKDEINFSAILDTYDYNISREAMTQCIMLIAKTFENAMHSIGALQNGYSRNNLVADIKNKLRTNVIDYLREYN